MIENVRKGRQGGEERDGGTKEEECARRGRRGENRMTKESKRFQDRVGCF